MLMKRRLIDRASGEPSRSSRGAVRGGGAGSCCQERLASDGNIAPSMGRIAEEHATILRVYAIRKAGRT